MKQFQLKPVILILIAMFLMLVPVWGSQYVLYMMFLIFFYAAIASMWNLLAGFTGLISLGQPMFLGLSGFTFAIMALYFGVPIWACFFIGAFVSAFFAMLISVPLFRMGGLYFAIGSWMIAEALRVTFGGWSYVKHNMGMTITPAYGLSFTAIYYTTLAVLFVALLVIFLLLRSKIGLALMAMRDDAEATETLGVSLFRYKLITYMVAAALTGAASVAYYSYNVYIVPESAFSITWTVSMAFIVIIGGFGTVEGPLVGSIIYVVLRQYLAEYGAMSMVILGIFTLAVILVFPQGIMGYFGEKYHINIFSTRRKPSASLIQEATAPKVD